MRVLVVHNQYRSELPSGENQVVLAEIDMLRAAGVDVDVFLRSSDEIEDFNLWQRVALVARPVHSIEDTRRLRQRLREWRPDVLHLHNPFPLISPSIIRVARAEGVPVVHTVHNFRHSCPAGDFFRDGRPCEDCAGKSVPWPAVVHGCYRGSRAQSAVMATAAAAHRSTWRMVARFLPVSEFIAQDLVRSGIPRDRIVVRPNSAEPRGAVRPPGDGFLFVGRLTPEKGLSLLLSAWNVSDVWRTQRLVVAGDGPQRDQLTGLEDRNVHYVGPVERERVTALLDECAIVVVPSQCYEGFPRLVAEAFERGRPVAATAEGSLRELVTSDVGWTAASDAHEFATMLSRAASDPSAPDKGVAARALFESRLTPEATTASLLHVYSAVVGGDA